VQSYILFVVTLCVGCIKICSTSKKAEWTTCPESLHDRRLAWNLWLVRVVYKQDAQLSQSDRAAGCVIVFAKSRRLELGDNILRHYRSIFNHCYIIGLKMCRIRWKKRKKCYYGVQGHSRSSRSVPIESPYATSY